MRNNFNISIKFFLLKNKNFFLFRKNSVQRNNISSRKICQNILQVYIFRYHFFSFSSLCILLFLISPLYKKIYKIIYKNKNIIYSFFDVLTKKNYLFIAKK